MRRHGVICPRRIEKRESYERAIFFANRILERTDRREKCKSRAVTVETRYVSTANSSGLNDPFSHTVKPLNGLIDHYYAHCIISGISLNRCWVSQPVGRILPRRPNFSLIQRFYSTPPCVSYFSPCGSWTVAHLLGANLSGTGAWNGGREDSRGNTWCFQKEATFKWVYIYIYIYIYSVSLSLSVKLLDHPSFITRRIVENSVTTLEWCMHRLSSG